MTNFTSSPRERLIFPALAPFYHSFAQPVGWLVFRLVVGGYLIQAGWPKITDPFAMAGWMDYLGFAPGAVFSLLVAVAEFFGGVLILLGLVTRPAAIAATIVLLVTLWFHAGNPYGPVFLSPEGIEFLTANPQYLTQAGQQALLGDGGAGFLAGAQSKAILTSLFWALSTALIAAFGGGKLSVDARLKKEF